MGRRGITFQQKIAVQYSHWCSEKADSLSDEERFPAPDRKLVALWAHRAWESISEDTVRKTMTKIGLDF